VRERQSLERTYIWSSFRPADPLYFFSDIAKAGLFHRVYLPTDYEGLVQDRIERYLRFVGPGQPRARGTYAPIGYYPVRLSPRNARLFDLLGVRFFILRDGMQRLYIDPALDIERRWRLLMKREDGVMVYENPQAMPRAFVAARVEVVADPDAVLDRLSTADLREVAFVEEPLDGPPPGAASALPLEARIIEYGANRVLLEGSSPGGGLLVLTDQHFPGWKAYVDGSPAPIHRADYLFRGIVLPAGKHRVELVYRPMSVAIGAAGTALAALAIGVIAWSSPRNR